MKKEMEKQDIYTESDVKQLVDTFYASVNADDLLSPVFNDVAKIDWPHHLPAMYSFWNTLLFGKMDYKGQPFPKHLALPIEPRHFERWLHIFTATVDSLFAGEKAEEAKHRAASIAHLFQYKMGFCRR
jgi:hemoglobin